MKHKKKLKRDIADLINISPPIKMSVKLGVDGQWNEKNRHRHEDNSIDEHESDEYYTRLSFYRK